jgi:hypothetical protein
MAISKICLSDRPLTVPLAAFAANEEDCAATNSIGLLKDVG